MRRKAGKVLVKFTCLCMVFCLVLSTTHIIFAAEPTADTTVPVIITVNAVKGDGILTAGDVVTLKFSEALENDSGQATNTVQEAVYTVMGAAYGEVGTSDNIHFDITILEGKTVDVSGAGKTITLDIGSIQDTATSTWNSAPISFTITDSDNTAPTATVPNATVKGGVDITAAQSSEVGYIYLVPSGDYTNKSDLDAVEGGTKAIVSVPDTDTTIVAPAAEGTYYLYAVDAGGNVSATSAGAITVDNTAPDAPTIVSVAGKSSSPATSNDSTPDVVINNVTNGDTINVYDGGTVVGTGTATGATITITTEALSEGVHTLTAKATDPAGNESTASDEFVYTYDGTAPTVTNVSSTKADGSYKVGEIIAITVEFSEVVDVDTGGGTPSLILETGTTDRDATYTGGSGTETLTFNYTVEDGDTSLDLDYVGTNSLTLNGGTIKDAASNNANLTLPEPGEAGSLGANKAIVIDTTAPAAPTIVSVAGETSSPATSNDPTPDVVISGLTAGDTVKVYDGAVEVGSKVAGAATETITLGALSEGVHTLTAKATDPAGNESTASGTFEYTYDGTAPTVTSVSSTTDDGSYKAGDVITVTVTFSEDVNVDETPIITLETGDTDRDAIYMGGSGTDTLTFDYTIQAGDASADLDYVATNSLSGTIKDAAGNDAILTLAAPGTAGSLGANANIVIDTTAPAVTNVSSAKEDGSYKAGEIIDVMVTFSEIVNVTGTPSLILETGTTDREAVYADGSGTETLTFNYTVEDGDTSLDLDYVGTNSLTLNGGTIKDAASNNANLTLPEPGEAGSLGANKAIVIDTTAPAAPTIASVAGETSSPATSNDPTPDVVISGLTAGDTVKVYDGAVEVGSKVAGAATETITTEALSEGVHTLTAKATDPAGNESTASDEFVYTYDSAALSVVLSHNHPDLIVKGSDENVIITAAFSVAMQEAPPPAISISGVGITDEPMSGSGTTWTYMWDVPDGYNGPAVVTVEGNDIGSNPYTGSANITFTVDNTAPVISSITSDANAAGVLKIGDSIVFTLTPGAAEPGAAVSGSYNGIALTWSSSDEGATYDATYTIAEGHTDQTSPLQISGVTITDAAGNTSATGAGSDVAKTIDAHTPVLTSVSIASNNANSEIANTGDSVTLTFTANEAIQTPSVSIGGNAVTPSGSGTSWTAVYTYVYAGVEGVIPFSIAFADIAGNSGTTVTATTNGTSVTFTTSSPPPSVGGGGGVGTPSSISPKTPSEAKLEISNIAGRVSVSSEQAGQAAKAVATIVDTLAGSKMTDHQKAVGMDVAASVVANLATIIGKTSDIKAAETVITEVCEMLEAMSTAAATIKEEKSMAESAVSISAALEKSAALLSAVKDSSLRGTIAEKISGLYDAIAASGMKVTAEDKAVEIMRGVTKALSAMDDILKALNDESERQMLTGKASGIFTAAGRIIDLLATPEKAMKAAKDIIRNTADIIVSDTDEASVEDISKGVAGVAEKAIGKLNREAITQPLLVGQTAKAVVTNAIADKILKKAESVTAVLTELEEEMDAGRIEEEIKTRMVIEVSKPEGTNTIETTLPVTLIDSLESKGIGKLEINAGIASIIIEPGTINGEGADTVSFTVKETDRDKDLTPDQRSAVGDSPVYDFNASVAGRDGSEKKVDSFGKPVEIAIPYVLKAGEDAEKLTVFLLNDKGELENKCGRYDPATGTVRFTVKHFSKYIVRQNDISFRDSEDVTWAKRYIEVMAAKGIVKGMSADRFEPGLPIKRAEFAALLVRMFGLEDDTAECNFEDVKPENWYYATVASAVKAGLVKGYDDGTFRSEEKISRQDMVTMAARAAQMYKDLKAPADTGKYLDFTDNAQLRDYAKEPAALAVKYGIMGGRPGKVFDPLNNATRAEAVKVIYLIYNR